MILAQSRFDGLSRWRFQVAFVLYLAFVIYGSLIPFDYRALSWGQALEGFRHIRFLHLGVVSRADWIANILLYIPLAFLGCSALLGMGRAGRPKAAGVALVGLFCLATAAAIEFVQQWFAPRTVSINDLIAESIGTLIGLLLWVFGRTGISRLADAFVRGGRPSLVAALAGYALVYLALSLFPFDFILSADELSWKLQSGNQGWLLSSACGGPLRCGARLTLDLLASAPFGLFAALLWPRRPLRAFFAAGILIGLVFETLQLLLVSGTSQGMSVLMRGLGLVAGALAGRWLRRIGPQSVARLLELAAPLLFLPYLAGLALVSGWFSVPALPLRQALTRLSEVHWLPLYYHYYTSEPVAMASALAQLAIYAPLGIWAWARVASGGSRDRGGPWTAVAAALTVSLVIEGGKLFFPPMHPDPTNWGLAVAGALVAYGLALWLERIFAGGEGPRQKEPPAPSETTRPGSGRRSRSRGGFDRGIAAQSPARVAGPAAASLVAAVVPEGAPAARASRPDPWAAALPEASAIVAGRRGTLPSVQPWGSADRDLAIWLQRAAAAAIGVLVLWLLVQYPVAPLALAAALALYGTALWRWPRAWLLVIPALVPALDLVPWSGWFYWESVDFFLAVTLMVVLARPWRATTPSVLPGTALILLLALSQAVSTVIGLLPPAAIDANAFSSYYSPYNALRVAKGFFWALALVPLARVTLNDRVAYRDFLIPGLILGFLGVMGALLYERQVFPGLLDFTDGFRVTASFSSMHTGGGHIEAYLSLVWPFILVLLLERRGVWVSAAGVVLLGLAGYGLAVTFSRASLIGLGVGLLVATLGLALALRASSPRRWARHGALFGLGAIALAAAVLPIVQGGFFKSRLAETGRDLPTHAAHWRDGIEQMDSGVATTLFGMGFGRFPAAYLVSHARDNPLATYQFGEEGGNRFLTLTAGDPLYFEQIVQMRPHQTYRLELDLRTRNPAPGLSVPVCAKSLLYSYTCRRLEVRDIRGDGAWHRYGLDFDSGDLGAGPWYSRRPTKLALYDAATGPGLDVDNISLTSPAQGEILRNGDFAAGQ